MTTPAPHNEAPIESATDPVCGRSFEANDAQQVYDFREQRYYFDSADCLRQFIEDPDKFMMAPDDEPEED